MSSEGALRVCKRCKEPLLQRADEPMLDFRRRRTCGADACRWTGESAAPRVRGEWPVGMDFSFQEHDPGDGFIRRLSGPQPALSPGDSSAAGLLDD